MVALASWLTWLIAVAIFVVILLAGVSFLLGVATMTPKEKIEPEDVAELDVFFVCGECGTEFQVTRLGEIQVPRHCGEPMKVVRRPRQERQGT